MTVQVHVLAAGFASKFESIGPYVGFGSLIAVAAMAVLVFAQGREIQRLREWTGRSPERLDELERTVAEQGAGAAPVQGRQLQPHPGAVAGRPPARTAAGQVVAPGAAAAAAAAAAAPPGAPPRPPGAPGAAPAVAAAGAPTAAGQATAVTGASTATGTATPPPSNRPVPPRPTPPGGGPAGPRPGGGPRPATPLGAAGATARERGEGGPQRSVPQLVGVGALLAVILVGVLFAAGVFGGGGSTDDRQSTPSMPTGERTTPNEPPYRPANISVAVLNASGIPRVAAAVTDRVDNNRFRTVSVNGSRQGGNLTRNGSAVTQTDSVVAYRGGASNRAAATAIARDLRLPGTSVQPISADIRTAAGTGNPDVVVVLGSTWVNSASGKRIVPDQAADAAGSGSDSTGTTSTGSSDATGSGSTGSTGTGGTSSGTGATGTSGATGTDGTAGTTDGTAGTTDGTGAATDGTASGGAGVTP